MSSNIKRQVKIITKQHVLQDRDSGVEGFPLRAWTIELVLVNAQGEDIPADIFSKVTYNLHESFGTRAKQVITDPPFRVAEEGWGEFDMQIDLTAKEKGGEHHILHDLNFQKASYDHKETITFKNPKPGLIDLLRDSGPVPGDENGGRKKDDLAKKKKSAKKGINMEELAENLQKLNEDDLLQVVQMIHDGKAQDSYTKNDVDGQSPGMDPHSPLSRKSMPRTPRVGKDGRMFPMDCNASWYGFPSGVRANVNPVAGEFHVDLYTLPDDLIQSLWTFTESKV